MRRIAIALSALLLLGLVAAGAWAWQRAVHSVQNPPTPDRTAYVGSGTCKACHANHHASWGKTYHRSMTQEATAKSVQGDFSGQTVTAWGVPMRPRQHGGKYYFDYLAPNGQTAQSMELVRTVGSHRYQQYLSKDAEGRYARMHLIWLNDEQRWVHYNAAFLYDDGQGFNQHATLWNPNCIFCHNTGVKPGLQNAAELQIGLAQGDGVDFMRDARWRSTVSELGIACEACHGPGGVHARANRNPLRRFALRQNGGQDGSIVNPKRLPVQRASEVCGQCHAQRLPAQDAFIWEWLQTGPSYRPGDQLEQHVRLIARDTQAEGGKPDAFALRFWPDGSPRLSAYEWTGLKQSTCAQAASCITCHSGHKGDPAGMLTAQNREGHACQTCHAKAAALPVHQAHAKAAGAQTNCVDCHMPKSVYGVMEIHRSHRIRSPQPLDAAQGNRPDACTGCHSTRSATWAASAIAAWQNGAAAPPEADTALPENLRQLFAGDAVQRAVAAKLAGFPRAALSAPERRAQLPLLLAAMDDGYPAIRRFAWQSLLASARILQLPAISEAAKDFDYTLPATKRAPVLATIAAALPPPSPVAHTWGGLLHPDGRINAEAVAALRAQAAVAPIGIGE